jgi:N6-adenosine-specific RNA methylase IME4
MNAFRAVLADPPLRFVTRSPKGEGRSALRHYETHSRETVLDHWPVRNMVDRDAGLSLWVPSPFLLDGLWLIEQWGFSFSGTAFCWVKTNRSGAGYFMGCGCTTRKNAELCLLGRRGSPPILAHDVRELIVSPRREHSRKPDEQYERIERLCAGPGAMGAPTLAGMDGLMRRGQQI